MISRIGITNVDRVDTWFDRAMNDPSVVPYLGTTTSRTRITVPEDDYDGVVLMNDYNTGLFKWYFDHDARTAKFCIFVLQTDFDRSGTAKRLMAEGLSVLRMHPDIDFIASRVKITNQHGINFSTRYLGEPWGEEPYGAYDCVSGEWVSLLHFKQSCKWVREAEEIS